MSDKLARRINQSREFKNLLNVGDSYMLHGITTYGEDFEISHMSQLLEEMQTHPESREAQWLAEENKWIAIMPNLNGN